MYKFKTSEKNNDKATEFETKSLLYLLTKIKGHDDVNLFIIDCFNDVTGVSENYAKSWDVQSKNVASLTPRTVGVALYTLFANYVSDIDFGNYILFLPQLKTIYLEDASLEVFSTDNFKQTKIEDIKKGLTNEIARRNDPDVHTPDSLSKLDSFLADVIFIHDRYGKSDYIKSIIDFKNVARLNDEFLTRIFDEIRAQQTAKKIRNVYGEEVTSIREAEQYDKNIYRKDLELLVVNRVIGNDLFSSRGVPLYFISEVHEMEEEDIEDLIQECQVKISQTLFNKNNKRAFWTLLEKIIILLEENKKLSIREMLGRIDTTVRESLFTMDEHSLLFLIALVKEGLKNENS